LYKELENIEQVLSGCRKDDRRAQELLYRSFYRAMMTLCLRYTKNDQDAVEVLNNGFLKVFKNIQRYDPGQASLYTWIRTIVVNACLDFIRSRNRQEQCQELDDSVEVHIPPEVVGRFRAAELLQLIRTLPPATQAVFNLYVLEGYTHKEIKELLNISAGTSKWHLSEARKLLQQRIQKEQVEIHE
jgi:RNA polymerase sigma-70 factor (ECF subfamily)